jgi:hypothetical protein
MSSKRLKKLLFAWALALLAVSVGDSKAQPSKPSAAGVGAVASDIADFFGQVGDQIYEQECIFELSQEQLEVQQALIEAYIKQGADSVVARQLAVKQIQPPHLSVECERIKNQSKAESAKSAPAAPPAPGSPAISAWRVEPAQPRATPEAPSAPITLADKRLLPQWDCAPGVDYVTIRHKGYDRKLTGGEICNPYEDVVRPVPDTLANFRFGYTIRTGRLFVLAAGSPAHGRTIAWAISGRDLCRNNPDPDCLATRAVGPLPPGEYSFASEKGERVSWGPKSKRMVAGIYLTNLWYRERYTPAQTAAILARGNIAIHVRLKGEMSEACLGLEPNGWAYVSSLIKDGRVTGVDVYIDDPFAQVAENPPIVKVSSFSFSLFSLSR